LVAYMDAEALERTQQSGQAWFYSRSRQELWHKGETSGSVMEVRSIQFDCDGDALLLQVYPAGPACHTGNSSCFFQDLERDVLPQQQPGPALLTTLAETIRKRRVDRPTGSYTAELFDRGTGAIAQKVIEEAGETAIAALMEGPERLASEAADLFYHALVLLETAGVPPEQVWQELRSRRH
jgi:phosphoribosyl-ATP pyrophosphohydrolase/phosphoribosyl-AMP cyclohydrolase